MKKNMKKIIYNILIITLGVATALLIYLHFFASDYKDISGEWTADLDMTEQAAVTAYSWLKDIEAVSISLENMESCMQDLTIQVYLTMEKSGRLGGNFQCNVVPESYEACNQAAYEAFAVAFRELLVERLRMAGYTGSTDEEAIEALVTETFGMSTVSYLMSCGPALLPSLEDLQDGYDGSGTYETAEGILTRQFDVGGAVTAKTERYIREGSDLVLFEETDSVPQSIFSGHYPMIYTLKQAQD